MGGLTLELELLFDMELWTAEAGGEAATTDVVGATGPLYSLSSLNTMLLRALDLGEAEAPELFMLCCCCVNMALDENWQEYGTQDSQCLKHL